MIIYEVSKKRLVNFEKVCDYAEAYLNEHPEMRLKEAKIYYDLYFNN